MKSGATDTCYCRLRLRGLVIAREAASGRKTLMQVAFAYRGRSGITQTNVGLAVALAPNLRRERVSFVGTLRQPLRFREAMSALHDVVISDLRFKPKDKTAYEAWKKEEAAKEARIRTDAAKMKRAELEK